MYANNDHVLLNEPIISYQIALGAFFGLRVKVCRLFFDIMCIRLQFHSTSCISTLVMSRACTLSSTMLLGHRYE